ncbi:ThiF family adenylyltransferase [Alkaliphilus hydrothermalis]|uniref:Adenylyltransferase/sulfurtransferase n=1 Tax=Alkaliphilus hydrothermalis TaxID=1482730 RepID=A0ABS2NP41_9FIRM|nr:ThiF family adenylyltransferase [Alkaliphilus hydrothermalis]MBM7614708.1 adenylyltransferase/sulfurtransferase [Alkaliphilus hydrothermalis]
MKDRYIKQINFKGIGEEGQERLKKSKVLIIGCGALGTVAANSLARTGVGTLRIVDRDFVEYSNLHRQILFDEEDAENSIPKVEAAKTKLQKVNSDITIETIVKDVNSITIEKMIEGMDLIIDCTDNFKTRYLINDTAFQHNIPWIYGGAVGSTGAIKMFIPGKTGCLRCMMDTPPSAGSIATCDTAGVINTTTGIVGMHQSTAAIKYLTGNLEALENKMIYFDLWENEFQTMQLPKKEGCTCCGNHKFEYLMDKMPEAIHICGNNTIQVDPQNSKGKVDLRQLYERLLEAAVEVKLSAFLLNIKVEGYEIKLFDDGRAIIKNAKTIEEAKGLYAKYIGY